MSSHKLAVQADNVGVELCLSLVTTLVTRGIPEDKWNAGLGDQTQTVEVAVQHAGLIRPATRWPVVTSIDPKDWPYPPEEDCRREWEELGDAKP